MGVSLPVSPPRPLLSLMLTRPSSSSLWMPLFRLDPRVAGPPDHRSCRPPKALLGPSG